MKQLSKHIFEALKINSKSKVSTFEFKSHITDTPIEFKNSNYIVGSGDFKPMRFSILIEYAKEILKLNLLEDKKDIEFCEEWLKRAKKAYKDNYVNGFNHNSEWKEFTWLCNGEDPTFGNAKFTYDLIQYGLHKTDTTKPRKQKLEKMIRDFWDKVDDHKNEMNWY
jgi:hypothetical protein